MFEPRALTLSQRCSYNVLTNTRKIEREGWFYGGTGVKRWDSTCLATEIGARPGRVRGTS